MRYQFKCEKCNKSFEFSITLAEYEAKKFTNAPNATARRSSNSSPRLPPTPPSTSFHVRRSADENQLVVIHKQPSWLFMESEPPDQI